MEFNIVEAHPDGRFTFAYIAERLDKMENKSGDYRDLFHTLIPQIKQAERYAFSSANPSGWKSLKESYRKWKTENGYPITIGIRTNALKEAATVKALTKVKKKKLEYRLNPSVVARDTSNLKARKMQRVKEYAHYFNRKRPVFKYARDYINDFVKKSVAEYIKQGYEHE